MFASKTRFCRRNLSKTKDIHKNQKVMILDFCSQTILSLFCFNVHCARSIIHDYTCFADGTPFEKEIFVWCVITKDTNNLNLNISYTNGVPVCKASVIIWRQLYLPSISYSLGGCPNYDKLKTTARSSLILNFEFDFELERSNHILEIL